MARELDETLVEDARLGTEEMNMICRCGGDMIDLLLDTGTVSNLVPEESRSVLSDVKKEKASLLGVE